MSTKRTRRTFGFHVEVGVAAVMMGGMSRRYVKELIKAGDLDGFLLGNRIVVSMSSLDKFMESRRITGDKEHVL